MLSFHEKWRQELSSARGLKLRALLFPATLDEPDSLRFYVRSKDGKSEEELFFAVTVQEILQSREMSSEGPKALRVVKGS